MRLRSVELDVRNRVAAVEFLQQPWGLIDVGTRKARLICAVRKTAPTCLR